MNTARNTAGRRGGLDELGLQRDVQRGFLRLLFHDAGGTCGITFIAASGDNGTVEYPSASPNVLSVGGTTLNLSSSGSYGSETAWFDSGGGYSQYERGAELSAVRPADRNAEHARRRFRRRPEYGRRGLRNRPGLEPGVVAGRRWNEPGRASLGGDHRDRRPGPRTRWRRRAWTVPRRPCRHSTRPPRPTFNSVSASPGRSGLPVGGFDPFGGSGLRLRATSLASGAVAPGRQPPVRPPTPRRASGRPSARRSSATSWPAPSPRR